MSEFVKISSSDLVKHQNISYDRRKPIRKSEQVLQLKETDDTSIYEYDYECLKRKGLIGYNSKELKKR